MYEKKMLFTPNNFLVPDTKESIINCTEERSGLMLHFLHNFISSVDGHLYIEVSGCGYVIFMILFGGCELRRSGSSYGKQGGADGAGEIDSDETCS